MSEHFMKNYNCYSYIQSMNPGLIVFILLPNLLPHTIPDGIVVGWISLLPTWNPSGILDKRNVENHLKQMAKNTMTSFWKIVGSLMCHWQVRGISWISQSKMMSFISLHDCQRPRDPSFVRMTRKKCVNFNNQNQRGTRRLHSGCLHS